MRRYILIIIFSLPLYLWSQTRKLSVEPNHSTIGFNISIVVFTQVAGKFTDYDIDLN